MLEEFDFCNVFGTVSLKHDGTDYPVWNMQTGQWKRSVFLSFQHTTDGTVKKHVYYDAK